MIKYIRVINMDYEKKCYEILKELDIPYESVSYSKEEKENKEKDLLYINIVKSRDGGDNRKLTYKADFNYGRFTYIPENLSAEEAKQTYDAYDGDGVF